MMSLLSVTEMFGMNLLASDAGQTFWMPEQASTIAPSIDNVFAFITYLCYFFFVLIVAVMIYFVFKYRRTHEGMPAEKSASHNTPIEVTWTVIPLILVIVIFYVGLRSYVRATTAPENAYEVYVTAQRWSWTFAHKNGVTDPGELVVPANRPVKLIMESMDVLHSLFVPAFRVKQDVVPGRTTYLWFEATKAGEYDLYCAEYCGQDHSQMSARVIVLPEDEFEAEIERRSRIIDELPDELLYTYGRQRVYPRCASCHSLDGSSGTGPTFTGLWDRTVKGETVLTNGQTVGDLIGPGREFEEPFNYIQDSILNPQQYLVQNFTGAMPTFKGQLEPREIRAMVEMLKDLEDPEKFDDQGNLVGE